MIRIGEKKYLNSGTVFAAAMFAGIVYSLISWSVTAGGSYSAIFFYDQNDTYMDFFNCLYYARDVIENGSPTIYPPLAHMIFYFVYRMVPPEIAEAGAKAVRTSQLGLTFMMLWSQVFSAALAALVYQIYHGKLSQRCAMVLALAVSAPWLNLLERGNIVMIAWLFASFYLAFYNSDSKLLRELALISLALSAGLKLYPAVLGALLLRDKKWKEAGRCILYGILVFFLPMLATPSGLGYALTMFSKYTVAADGLTAAGFSTKVNLDNIIRLTFAFFHEMGDGVTAFSGTLTWILILLAIVGALITPNLWEAMVLLVVAMYSIPSFASKYVLNYLMIPLLLFLNSNVCRKKTAFSKIILLLFIIIFIPLDIGGADFFPHLDTTRPVSFNSFTEGYAATLLFLILLVRAYVYGFISVKRSVSVRRRVLCLAGSAAFVVASVAFTVVRTYRAIENEMPIVLIGASNIYDMEHTRMGRGKTLDFVWSNEEMVLKLRNKHSEARQFVIEFTTGYHRDIPRNAQIIFICDGVERQVKLTSAGQTVSATLLLPPGTNEVTVTTNMDKVPVNAAQDPRSLYFTVSDLTVTDVETGRSMNLLQSEDE